MLARTIALILALTFASPAAVWAHTCPALVKEIDAALAESADLSPEARAEVKALRDEGEVLHESGKHDESVELLERALELLGLD